MSFSRANKITRLTRIFQKQCVILSPFYLFSAAVQVLSAFPRFAAFVLLRDHLTPGLSNSRFCTFEGAPVLPFPCHRDSNLPRGSKPFNSGKPDICPLSSFFCRGMACKGFASSPDPRTALGCRGAAQCGQPQWLWCISPASCRQHTADAPAGMLCSTSATGCCNRAWTLTAPLPDAVPGVLHCISVRTEPKPDSRDACRVCLVCMASVSSSPVCVATRSRFFLFFLT